MDKRSAQILNQLNAAFYRENAASFSATRSFPWPGWARMAKAIAAPKTVLDLGAGNMRFERFLLECYPETPPAFFCVDVTPALSDMRQDVRFQQIDLVEALVDGCDLAAHIDAPLCDLTVAFGLVHHVPDLQSRIRLVDAMLQKTAPSGYACLSFWRFMDDPRIAAKALQTTERARRRIGADLDENDYILGWQDAVDAYRYCHHFDDAEVDRILQGTTQRFQLVDRFQADGRSNSLNTYVLLRKLP